MTSSFTGLGADEINTNLERLLDVLGVADHVHNEDTGLVELVDGPFGWDTDGRDEEGGLLGDDNINEFGELTLSVIGLRVDMSDLLCGKIHMQETTYIGLASASTDLGEKEIDTERSVLVLEVLFDQLDLWAINSSALRCASNWCENDGATAAQANAHFA